MSEKLSAKSKAVRAAKMIERFLSGDAYVVVVIPHGEGVPGVAGNIEPESMPTVAKALRAVSGKTEQFDDH
jgi:hypothetical protein